VSAEKIFATPRKVEDVADCYFYHTMELPGRGVIEGRDWDLRGRVDEYLGNVDFGGQRVLEIGPASGFLTFEMEKRGADVISVEVTDEHGWDFVPYPHARLEEVFGPRRIAAVLLHCRDPLRIVEQCGKRAKSLIIVDKFHPDLEGAPVCRFAPTPENFLWHTWWHFSTQFFKQYLAVMGFTTSGSLTHEQYHRGRAHTLFTLVGRR